MRNLLCGVVALAVVMMVGCGDDGPKVYKVTGTVTLNGQPVPQGTTVSFIPKVPTGMQPASGSTDAQGKYTLNSPANPNKVGALPGDYMVAIHNRVPDDNLTDEEREEKRQRELANGGMASGGKLKDLVPKQYGSAATSGFTATVAENDENVFDFDLK